MYHVCLNMYNVHLTVRARANHLSILVVGPLYVVGRGGGGVRGGGVRT